MPGDDIKIKKRLFGESVTDQTKKGSSTLDLSLLSQPFEWKEAVTYLFCQKCGMLSEVNRQGAEYLCGQAKAQAPEVFKNVYFTSEACSLCGQDIGVRINYIN
ncbi:MAG: hypothetical protein Q7R92_03715 [bacterium]|nr:hypothetical protein [bacterium]